MLLINTTSLDLEEFLGEPTSPRFPRYAILSHTWGEEEVTFQDMQNREVAKKKAGFGKIAKCCKTALNEGLGWAWVDTCCIDKTSSAELSEGVFPFSSAKFGACRSLLMIFNQRSTLCLSGMNIQQYAMRI